eukprot:scaffold52694_cov58-Attheya_sp.AAC.2
MEKDNIDAYLIQETWIPEDWTKIINGYYVFNHGTEENEDPPTARRGHARGGVAIILSPRATAAWKAAGQPDPIKSGTILGCARYIAIELHFLDHLQKKVKMYLCSVYHPTGVSPQERAEFLDNVGALYNMLDSKGHILISGCDINSSIGNRESTFGNQDGI